MYNRIVIPLDGSELAESVIPYALPLARALNSEIHLVRVIPMTTELINLGMMDAATMGSGVVADAEVWEEMLATQARQAQEYLEQKSKALSLDGYRTQATAIRGDPGYQINEYVRDHDAELIAISTHGRSGIPRFVMGSVADKVVQHARVPVLLVTPLVIEEARSSTDQRE